MKERAVRVSIPPILWRGYKTLLRPIVTPNWPLLVLLPPADCIANSSKQVRQTRRGLLDCSGRRNLLLVQSLQATIPHFRQWCRLHRYAPSHPRGWTGKSHLLTKENWTFLQCMQVLASLSGTQTAAWLSAGFLPDFRMSSSIHCKDVNIKH